MRPRVSIVFLLCLLAAAALSQPAAAAPKKAQIKFSSAAYSIAENAGTFNLVVQRSGNTAITASAAIAVDAASTAVGGGTHYTYSGPSTVSFAAGETSKTIPVAIHDNATANAPNKTIVFRLSAPAPAGTQLKNNPATLTIVDDEGPGQIDFTSSSYTVLESGGNATVTVARNGAPNLSLSVQVATGSAAVDPATPTADYTQINPPQTLIFAPGEMSKTFQVQITDDSNAESPENVLLDLSSPQNLSGGAAPTLGANDPATLTINDDDVSVFGFASSLFSAGESAGSATVTVNRTGATNIPASIGYSTSDGTATGGVDYTPASGTLNFAAGETQKSFPVAILPDTSDEANESINLALSNGASASLSIVDDDIPNESVQFSSTSYRVNEAAGTATITVELSHELGVATTVRYTTADGTADASDYTSDSDTLAFAAGETAKTFEVPIANPSPPDPEDDETITLTLSNPGTNLVLGSPSTATLTIVDDDPPGTLEFKALVHDVAETDAHATVTVERVGGVGGAVSVDYATTDGTASAGSDYRATSGTLNWAAGDGADKTFTVPITWDGRGEALETVNVQLSNANGGDLGPHNAAIIRIADDGDSSPVEFTAAAYEVAESAGKATITVARNGEKLGGPVTVDYATSPGTASADTDYSDTRGTLTFAAGARTASFEIPISADGESEATEVVNIALSNAGGGTSLGSPALAALSIADDDPRPQANPPAAATPAAARDTKAPRLTLAARKLQRVLRLKKKVLTLKARSDETASGTAVVRLAAGKSGVTLGAAKVRLVAGKTLVLRVTLTRKGLAALRKALASHSRRSATATLTVSDAAGNRASTKRIFTLAR